VAVGQVQQRDVAERPQRVVEARIARPVGRARVERQARDRRGGERVEEVAASLAYALTRLASLGSLSPRAGRGMG
jgi:hypothetical protein